MEKVDEYFLYSFLIIVDELKVLDVTKFVNFLFFSTCL